MDKDKRRKKKRRKKSKSGFTLIEIIGVIIIIGIIAIITVPAISKYVNNSKEKTYITYEENMKVATENKVVECISGNDKGCYLPESGEKKIVYLNELVESGYMDSLKDPENDGFCSNELSYVEVTNTNGANYEYKACLYCGNYTTEDAICTEYEFDAEKPVCGTVEGESTKWTNSNRTIIVGCSDSSSGCRSTTFSKTFTETTKNGEVTIVDRSGNTTNCPVEVYVDKTMPKCTLEIVGGTQEATGWLSGDVSVKLVSWSDSDSGVLTYGIGTSINNRNYNKQTSIKVNNGLTTVIGYVKDYAGNEGTCAVDVRVGAPKPEFDIEYGYQIYPSKEAYTLVNMTESGTKLTSTTTDPQISFTELNDYKEITRVRVRFNTAIPATTTAQLFYSNGTHTEANSVKALLVQGQKIVEFVVPKGSYKNLRLDLGSLNNTTFDIEKIEVMVGDRSTLFTNKNVSVNLIPKNETVRTTNYSFDNGATWQDINYKDYSDNITGSAKTKNIATLISDPAKTYKIENIDKGVPKVTITVTEKTNGAEVESNVWVDDNLNFKLVSSKVGSSGATIYYCKDTNNTCNPTTEVASGTMVTALNTTEGIYYIRYKVVSGAGTSSEISSFTAKVDKTKPTITSVTGNPTSWTNQDVTLVINGAKDGESKLPDKPYSFNGGETWQATNSKIYTANTNNIVIKVRDIAGNVYTHTAINITKIDKEKPSCELKVTSGSQVNGYYYTDVTVGFAKTTDTGGSEVKEYGIGDFTTKTVTLNEDKNVTYTANIRDNAGNTNTCTITVRRQNTFTLTYNSNGGNICSPSSRDISYGSKYGALCSPTRAGYSFAGWYTEAAGGTKITADTTVTATENQTLYAHWTKCAVGTYNTGNKSTCTACPTGYTSDKGATAENKCYVTVADGKYLGAAKGTTQTACPAGTYKSSHRVNYGSTSSCGTCATGTFSTGGAKVCTTCPSGYTSLAGATAQNKCYITVEAGKYIATSGTATKSTCPAGTAKGQHDVYYGSTSSCGKCPAGTYSPVGSGTCINCPNGYTSLAGATAENKCYINVEAGKYIGTAKSATKSTCAAGTSKEEHQVYYGSTSSCGTCPAGTYSIAGSGSCTTCPNGYTSLAGATAENKCYINVEAGKYIGTAKTAVKNTCAAGTAKAAHQVYYGSTSSCATCTAGTFSTSGSGSCTDCPSGYTSDKGATAQNKCYIKVDAGKYLGTAKGTTQTACPAGTASLSHNVYYGSTSQCSKCAAGTYSTAGTAICSVCPNGYTSDEGATAQNKCYIKLDNGQYLGTAKSAVKNTCAAGTAKAAHQVYYGSTSSCTTCTAGTYSAQGAGSCTDCPSGYTSLAGATAQNKCYINVSDGKYLGTAKGTTQTSCAAGKFKSAHQVYYGSTSSCDTCAVGTYSTGGAKICTDCPGSYTSAQGATAEDKCYISVEAGKYIGTAKSSTKTSCAAGTSSSNHTVYYGKTSSCGSCPEGKYSAAGSGTCTSCPTAYQYSAAGSDSIEDCYMKVDNGYYVKTAKDTAATKCSGGYAKGSHTVYYGKTSTCNQCGAGKYSAAGSASCSTCPTAYQYSAAGSDSITDCYMNVGDGYYVKTAKDTAATKCSAGYAKTAHTVYYNSVSSCGKCPAGKYSAAGSASCSTCGAGTQSAAGSASCGKCPAGTYSAAGSSSCTACPNGTYSAAGAKSCTTCPNGTFNTGTGNSTCSACTAGYKCTSGIREICGAGTYSTSGSSSCTTCPAGKYNTGTGNSSCSPCPAGYKCTGGTSKVQCTAGTYSAAGSGSCTACPGGYPNSAAGATSPTSCYMNVAAGNYIAAGTNTIATQCKAGTYKGAHTVYYGSVSTCDNCPSGYTSAAGSTAANQCKITCNGGYVASSGAKCTPCPAGTSKGSHTVSNGSTSSCSSCAAGTYNTTTGNSSCTPCPAGSYCPGGKTITTCAANTYSTAGAKTCTSCPSGYTSAAGSTAASQCKITCNGGYVATSGAKCTACPAGTSKGSHTVSNGSTSSCSACAAGTYNTTTGNSSCTSCPAGSYCEGRKHIATCPAGKYSTGGASSCTSCPSGYTSASGATAQTSCYISVSAGKYLASAKGTTQSSCTSGTYKEAHTVYYGSTSNCRICPGGYENSPTGSEFITQCYMNVSAGYRVETPTGGSIKCAAGTYGGAHTVNYGSHSSCTSCPTNYTNISEGSDSISDCYMSVGAGYRVASPTSAAIKCSAGYYRSGHNVYYGDTSSCYKCGAGYYSGEGAAGCTSCPSGYTNSGGGTSRSSCTITCGAGKYLASSGATSCSSCPAGKYSSGATIAYGGVSGCSSCPAGTYASSTGTSQCSPCPGGYPNSASGSDSPTDCYMNVSGGHYIAAGTNTIQSQCSAGTYKAAHTVYYGSASSCSSCGTGKYSAAGASSCSSCPSGYTCTSGTSIYSCYMNVSAGYYKVSSTGSQVNACDGGTYRASHVSYYGSSDYCSSCSAGTYSTGGASSCLTCPSGSTSGAGASSCYPTCTRKESCGCETYSAWTTQYYETKSYSCSRSFPVYSGNTRWTSCSKKGCSNSSCSTCKYSCARQTRECTQYKCC